MNPNFPDGLLAAGGRKLVLMPGGVPPRGSSAEDTTLVKALARAFRWRRMMEAGRDWDVVLLYRAVEFQATGRSKTRQS